MGDVLRMDIDTMRFVLVASIVAGAAVYARRGLTAGGTLTAGYLVIMAIGGSWGAIGGIAVVAAAAVGVVRGALTRHFALPKEWVFAALVAASASSTSLLHLAVGPPDHLGLPGGLRAALAVGAYVTPGLIAYDLVHQGIRPTVEGLAAVLAGTLALVVPALVLINWWRPESTTIYVPAPGNIPEGWFWLAALAATFMSVALRLSFGVRAAGFLGSVFLVEFLTLEAFVTVIAAAVAAAAIVDLAGRVLVLTPRQRFQLTLAVGAMSAWTGLYWGTRLGWAPAVEANAYALEPLLAVGLLATDLSRRRTPSILALAGLVGTAGFVWAIVTMGSSGTTSGGLGAACAVVAVPACLGAPAVRELVGRWRNAVVLGAEAAARTRARASRS